jgi:DnaJ-domain-containing protein 1
VQHPGDERDHEEEDRGGDGQRDPFRSGLLSHGQTLISSVRLITVLYFSDPAVRQKLFDAVSSARKPLLVSGVRHGKAMRAPQFRDPFAGLEGAFGQTVDQLIVADDGTVEGMWRDPLGDLADALFPDDRAKAYAVSNGYALLRGREVLGVVKKHRSPQDDRWYLQELLASHFADIPTPPKAQRPGTQQAEGREEPPRPRGRRIEDEDTNPRARPPSPPPNSSGPDPYAVLGLSRGVSKDDAKKAFRALIAQYHPDKVSHLAPEFRELADRRTREILAAWELVEKEVGQ